MTSRRQVIGMGVAGLAAAAFPTLRAAPSTGPATTLLRAADVHVDGYPTVQAVRWMGKWLRERTDGRLDTFVYYAGQLGSEANTVNLARFGALSMTRVYLAAMNNAIPTTRVLSLPFLIDSTPHLRRVIDGPVGASLLADFAKRDLVGLAFYDGGSRSFYNTKRPIHVPADLHGLKIRVPASEIFVRMVHALGANATPLPFGEIFSGMETHLIDGAENNIKSFQSSRHFEVAHYWSETRHVFTPDVLLMSAKVMASLPPADQALVREAAAASVPYMRGLWDVAEEEARATIMASKVVMNTVDREPLREGTRDIVRTWLRDPVLARLYENVRASM